MKKSDENLKSILPDFQERLHSKLLFCDFELSALFNDIKRIYDIFKAAKKRFDRKDTLNISTSLCNFMQLKKDEADFPYVLHDFKNNATRVCVCQYRKHYYVFANSPFVDIKRIYKDSYVFQDFYGGYDRLSDAVSLFVHIVASCCKYVIEELPF